MNFHLIVKHIEDLGSGRASALRLNSFRVFGLLKVGFDKPNMSKKEAIAFLTACGCTRHERTVNIDYLIRNKWIGVSTDGSMWFLRGKAWQVAQEGVAQRRMAVKIDSDALTDRKTWKEYIASLYISLLISRRAYNVVRKSQGSTTGGFKTFYSRSQNLASTIFTLDMISFNTGKGKSSSSRLRKLAEKSVVAPVTVYRNFNVLPDAITSQLKLSRWHFLTAAAANGINPARVMIKCFSGARGWVAGVTQASEIQVDLVKGRQVRVKHGSTSGLPVRAPRYKDKGEAKARLLRGLMLREAFAQRSKVMTAPELVL